MHVLVTGANRGIGLGLVKHYLSAGNNVVATAREPQTAGALTALNNEFGDQLAVEQLDVTCEQSAHHLADRLSASLIQLDLVINNAGICQEQSFGEWTAEGFKQQLDTNVVGPALLSQAIVPLMSDDSKLINISSGMGSIEQNLNPEGPYDGYSTSKAAVNMLTRRLAGQLNSQGIAVVCMDPGWVQTDMGGSGAPTPIPEAVAQIATTIEKISLNNSGNFLHASGSEVPW